ncbi:MAG TPA: D-cysteine desulfhydrase family protein [Azospirillaceae bacterium]|nr:D-cysteine desulfhydrase family protein [Azospirillaceae bacterium]
MTMDAATMLCHLPTPLEELPRLTAHLGGPRLLVKRDDCTGLAGGGNKARKLGPVLEEARRCGVTAILTSGAVQSNHVRQTAAAAARLGLPCTAVLVRRVALEGDEYMEGGNVLLDRLLGATVHTVGTTDEAASLLDTLVRDLAGDGHVPHVIPVGASDPHGSSAYTRCMQELVDQCSRIGVEPTRIIVASGSGGTVAGLTAGRLMHGGPPVTAVSVYDVDAAQHAARLADLTTRTARLLGLGRSFHPDQFDVRGQYLGAGYGLPTREGLDAVALMARLEGILLDPVYTGKAMAGLIDLVRTGELTARDTVVFLHTGGLPGLLAYRPFWPSA